MTISRGLIIAEPWIDHILEGRKDWEMRARPTAHRGWFGLIKKGSGTVVGLARLVECGRELDRNEMIASYDHHHIPEAMIRRGEVAKWVFPWKLADIIPLARPVPYEHKSGALTWVTLSPEVGRKLELHRDYGTAATEIAPLAREVVHVVELTSATHAAPNPVTPNRPDHESIPPLPERAGKAIGRSVLSGGNIRNNHIKLAPLMHAFPQDVIGGSNKSQIAPRRLEIDWGGAEPVTTDIDGTKSIFRARGWVRRFFEASGAREDDIVIFTETAPYRISVRLERSRPIM